ncbi:hypothetical protein Z042_01910 [Chania multitudinisentens RB-25]|uniref:Fimbrial-type adhesion domain-containing protein n=1 Tax=Chania multitudinisentens RB-25 TaxID=1441930 RepID=W0L8E4_9GAMM|nr:hypothetical protein Z042_01910 [Chania multitudinisentens RB-25]
MSSPAPKAAETITIGKNSGIVWEGMPFSASLIGYIGGQRHSPYAGLTSISDIRTACLQTSKLTTIAGYKALQIAPGVGLIPRATANATYTLNTGVQETLAGTIGLPITEGRTSSGHVITGPVYSGTREWCLPPRTTIIEFFYSTSVRRNVQIAGTWVMVADGTQTSRQVAVPPMYAGSYQNVAGYDLTQQILPSEITLRISTLICTVATTTNINFGGVQRNTQAGSELARLTYPLTVSCSQDTDRINANINVQFRAISGLYSATPTRLALTQGGGYITGEIDNGITGSGACNGTTGIPFDNTQLKVGSIASAETAKAFNNQITWRLCSGGTSLPTGPVDASTEMLVTFN